jgi:hypothetical protein
MNHTTTTITVLVVIAVATSLAAGIVVAILGTNHSVFAHKEYQKNYDKFNKEKSGRDGDQYLKCIVVENGGISDSSCNNYDGLTPTPTPTPTPTCPAGFTLQRGECTQPAVIICSSIFGPSVPGTPGPAGTCDYVGTTSTLTKSMCQGAGLGSVFSEFVSGATSCEVLNEQVLGCPDGGQLVNNECITRPGGGNQP